MKCLCFQETPNNVDYSNDFDNWNTPISLDNEEKSPPDQEVSEVYIDVTQFNVQQDRSKHYLLVVFCINKDVLID